MFHVKGEPKALAEEKLAGQDLVPGRFLKLLRESGTIKFLASASQRPTRQVYLAFETFVNSLGSTRIMTLGLATEEQARLEHLGGRIRHDAVGHVEAAQEHGRRGPHVGPQVEEVARP
jgi:hypothetical protein